jgi:beta-galactosidase/beta-glucuronidase
MKACDEVGLYVMDEAFDYWYRPKGGNPHCGLFLDTFREDTRAMVQDAYNHPCVVIYSIGNEIPEAGGVKGGDRGHYPQHRCHKAHHPLPQRPLAAGISGRRSVPDKGRGRMDGGEP